MPAKAHTSQPVEGRLTDRYPDELAFFKKVFLWTGCRDGCYVRYGYEPMAVGSTKKQKWSPLKSKGHWQHLYPELVDSLAEKHLDFDNFARTCDSKDRLRPHDWETAFWVGTMVGQHTHTHVIDLDNHEYIGWNGVPTRWHPVRTGRAAGPWSYRYLPVVRPSLSFFVKAKVVYDGFPNRIWAFSSGNLGLSVWKLYKQQDLTQVIHDRHQNRLRGVGLPTMEHYPLPPKTKGSLGRCHRRPCGLDSGVITPSGVLTDPIDQIRWFMLPKGTPTFDYILSACWTMLDKMYEEFLSGGESLDHARLSVERRKALVAECRTVVGQVKDWAGRGCPIDTSLLQTTEMNEQREADHQLSSSAELVTHIVKGTGGEGSQEEDGEGALSAAVPASFRQVDLHAIVKIGQWLPFVRFLVQNGIPCEDKFYEVISTLAKWFCFVEFYGRPQEEVSEVLRQYILTKHNGMVTRLNNGETSEVVAQVDRIVAHVLRTRTIEADHFYQELRGKRTSGKYYEVWNFGPQITRSTSATKAEPPPPSMNPSPPSLLLCGSLTEATSQDEAQQEWTYMPDDTPLSDFVLERIRAAFRRRKRQLRKNKAGRYPTLDAITRFFNYLLAGRQQGQRRASKELLIKMGFPSSGTKRDRIINVLRRDGMLRKGGYRTRELSRLWKLAPDVIRAC